MPLPSVGLVEHEMKWRALLLACACLLVWALPFANAEETSVVIVNASNPVSSLDRKHVSKIFLKRVTRWEGGLTVDPVDQPAESEARIAFSAAVHGKDAATIEALWRRVVFSGTDVPPIKLESDEEVMSFVRSNAGAVGYVSAGTALGDGIKVLEITG